MLVLLLLGLLPLCQGGCWNKDPSFWASSLKYEVSPLVERLTPTVRVLWESILYNPQCVDAFKAQFTANTVAKEVISEDTTELSWTVTNLRPNDKSKLSKRGTFAFQPVFFFFI